MSSNGELPQPNVTNDGYLIPTQEQIDYFKTLEVLLVVPHADYSNPAKFTKCLANMIAYSWHYGLRIFQMGATERTVVDLERS